LTYIDMPSHMRAVPVVIAILAALLPPPLHAGEVSVIYRFDDPVVAEAGRGFSRISFPATIQSGRPGEPSYPFSGIAILLPPGEAHLV
jgi:hypothetical protein